MFRKKIKTLIKHYPILNCFIKIYNYIPFNNFLKIGITNILECYGILSRTKIRIKGKENRIIIGKLSRLVNCNIEIKGNNNTIIIGDECLVNKGDLFIEDSNGQIQIGNGTAICGYTHLACIEGCTISIGNDCLFSSDVIIRTGDSHSIISQISKQRINPSRNVHIGNHVWVGNKVNILKNVKISDNTIIGTGSVVTKSFYDENVAIAGNPAKVLKSDINWLGERI